MTRTQYGNCPITIVTGFLGAGKTTLLRQLLERPEFSETALIINEVGEAVVDQLLFGEKRVAPIILAGGCICCTLVEDIGYTLRDLHERRAQGLIPPFKRVVIETTGLADPGPLVTRLLTDGWIGDRFSLGLVITVADATNIGRTVSVSPEAAVQIALADRVVISKADLVDEAATAEAIAHIVKVNPTAQVIKADRGDVPSDAFLAARSSGAMATPAAHSHHHAAGIETASMKISQPLVWSRAARALDVMFARHRDRLLRLKGVLNIEGCPKPVSVNGVQGVFYPPELLASWNQMERGSRVVVIARDADPRAMLGELRERLGSMPDQINLVSEGTL